jgi:selenocysteine-specific elongation factor
VVPVSAPQGRGIDELRGALDRAAVAVPGRAGSTEGPRLHVDRSFTLKGIGTVVTGTLWSGSLAAGDRVRILPRELEARVRSVQVHDRPVERAEAGQRVALNLAGVGWREVGRGDVVTTAGDPLAPTYLIDAELALEPGADALRRGERLHVHHGTREAPARVVPLGDSLAQLRLEAPLVPAAGDRLVLRRLAPPDTVGGGTVVDPHPRKHGPGSKPRPEREPAAKPSEPAPAPALDEAALGLAELLRSDGERPRTDAELATAAGLDEKAAAERLRTLERVGQAVRVARNLHFDPAALEGIVARVVAICERDGAATIAGVRDELGTSRKYAQAVLEHLDAIKLTRRRGDEHVLRGA